MKKEKKYKAQEKIKRHIDRTKHITPFTTTPAIVLKWWHVLNKAVFDSKLKPPHKIECKNFHERMHGYCQTYMSENKNDRTITDIGIRRTLPNREVFLSLLAHEMVHQWQWATKKKMGHGKSFKQWIPVFKETVNIQLTCTVDLE